MKFLLSAILVLGLGTFARGGDTAPPAVAPKETKEFTGEALKLKEAMVELFEASKGANAADPALRKKSRERVDRAMDWERIARDCFGKNRWGAQSAKNRKDFRELLQDVVIRTAYGRLDKFWKDTKKYDVDKIEIKGTTAHVATKFLVDKEDFLLEYYLTKESKDWKIYDIAFEDLKYSENISEQINAFMKDNNFNTLLDKLRKRRDELKEDKKS